MFNQGAEIEHIEPIVRTSLLEIFLETANQLRQDNPEKDWRWDIAFHGTLPENISSIVEQGFKIPNQGLGSHKPRFLVNWGPGLYCSPYGTYSYTYGHRWDYRDRGFNVIGDPGAAVGIFLCAVLRGTAFNCSKNRCRKYEGLQRGYDSHVCPSKNEWIVFDEKRIIPLCIMWVKKDVTEDVFFSDHCRVRPCSANGSSRERTRILLASPKEMFYKYQRYRIEYFWGQNRAEVISELKEKIMNFGTKVGKPRNTSI
jgi:hypothetical protein